MTQNEIDIIKREVAARLPYGVKVNVNSTIYKDPMTVLGIDYSKEIVKVGENIDGMFFTHNERAADVKPYLRPMESMTDDEKKKAQMYLIEIHDWGLPAYAMAVYLEWLNSIHVDYRNWIEQGLALVAPDGMYDFSDTDESCNK